MKRRSRNERDSRGNSMRALGFVSQKLSRAKFLVRVLQKAQLTADVSTACDSLLYQQWAHLPPDPCVPLRTPSPHVIAGEELTSGQKQCMYSGSSLLQLAILYNKIRTNAWCAQWSAPCGS